MAYAAPATFNFKVTIQNKSSTILRAEENSRKYNGVLLSPTPLKIPETTLYIILVMIPQKITRI